MKRMTSKKIFLTKSYYLWIVVLLFTAFIFACGTKQNVSKEGDEKVTIRYMRWGVPEELEAEKELIKIFNDTNPNIEIKLEVTAWLEYWRKLQAQLGAHSAPDVFLMGGEYLYDFIDKDVLVDLTDKIEKDNFDLSQYFSNPINIFRYKDGLWGLPRDCNTSAIFYNKTLFEKEGIPLPTDDWTWEDFLNAAKKATKDIDNDGRIDQWGYVISHSSAEVWWAPFIWQNGGEILNKERTKCLIDQPEAIEAVQFMVDLIHKYKVAPTLADLAAYGSTVDNFFLTGNLAMQSSGSWMLRLFRKIEKFEWDIVPPPKGKIKSASVNGLANVIYKESKHQQEAWQFVKFLSSEVYQENLAKSGTSIPALKKVAFSDAFLKSHEHPKNIKILLDQLEYAHPMDFTPKYARWDDILMKEIELALLGKKTPAEACRDGAEQTNEILGTIEK